jgi:type VI secretion system protein ImpL
LAAFWLASQNTAVDSADIKNAFQPVQFVVPPENKDRYIAPSNSPYMNSLVGLQAAVEQAAAGTGGANDPLMAQVNSQASGAKVVTRQVAQNFHIDAEGQVHAMVQKLMEDPILQVESLVRGIGPAELNAKAGGFCAQFRDLMSKYPFQAGATRLATIQEVNAIFQPGQGALWLLYDSSLKNYLTKQGAQYVPKPDGGVPLNPAFVNFFNHAAAVSETLYPGGSQTPNLSYTLRMGTPQGLQSLAFSIDNQTVTASKGKLSSKGFSWPGGGSQEVKLVGKFGSGPDITFTSYSGLWAVFQFFGDADRWQTSGSASRLEWVLRQGRAGTPLRLPDGSALVVQFDLETPGAAPVFQKGFLGGLACVARAAP